MKVFSFSEATNSRWKGSAARYNLQKVQQTRQPNAKSCLFQNKNTSTQSTLGDTGSLSEDAFILELKMERNHPEE